MFGFGSAQLGIGIAVALDNKFSANARNVTASMMQMKKANTQLIEQAANDYRNKAGIIAASAMLATKGMVSATQEGANFGRQIQKIAIIADGKLGSKALKKMALDMSEFFRMDPNKTSAALFENVKAGVTDNIDLITRYQVAVAKATDETLEGEEGVAKGLLNITNAFRIAYSEFPKVANAITVAANASQASVSSLNESLKYSAATAYAAGYSYTETFASLALLSQAGIQGTSAGTALSNLIRYTTKAGGQFATKRQTTALGMMGLKPGDLRDAKGNVIPLLDLLDLLFKRLKGLPSGKVLDILEALTGVRGEKAAINLMGADSRGYTARSFYNQINQGVGSDIAMTQAKAMMNNLAGDFDLVKVKWMQFIIAFTDAVEPLMRKALPLLTKFLNGMIYFMKSPVGRVLANFAMVMTPLIGALFAFRVALITTAFALGRVGEGSTFASLFPALLGSMGKKGMAGSALTRNAAGNWVVKAGQSFSHGGRSWAGGQMLPKGVLNQLGIANGLSIASSTVGLGSWASKLFGVAGKTGVAATAGTTLMSKFLPALGRLAGFVTGPWGLAAMAAFTVVPMIFDWLKKPEKDSTLKGYMPEGYQGPPLTGYERSRVDALNKLGLGDLANKELINNLTININGKQAYKASLTEEDNDIILNQLNQNF